MSSLAAFIVWVNREEYSDCGEIRFYTPSTSHKPSLVVSGVSPELLKGALSCKMTPHLCEGELCLLIPGIHLALPSPKGLVAVRTGSDPWGGFQRDLLLR